MLIKSIYIRDGLFERNISFGTNANLIYSEKNSCGKTTLVRFILYALGYSIPSTKKIKFEKCFVKVQLVLDNRKCVYLTRESNSTISFICDNEEKIYILPEQIRELHSKIFNLNYSWISIRPNNCTMSSKIDSGSSNYSEIICQKGIKSLWQFLEELFSCQGSLIVAIPAVHTVC